MVNSLKKGHRYEREVAKWLSNATGALFYRTPNSGATATSMKIGEFAGDILTNDARFANTVIECKHYRKPVTLDDLFASKSYFWEWVHQATKEADGRDWILFFKANRGGTFVCWSNSAMQLCLEIRHLLEEPLRIGGLFVSKIR
ncbi:MAG: hypothetical protein ABIM30_05975 [candidate division WOR-3 bacterium]